MALRVSQTTETLADDALIVIYSVPHLLEGWFEDCQALDKRISYA